MAEAAAESPSPNDHSPDDEFDLNTTMDRLKEFSYYLVENVEANLNLCLDLLEERDVQSKPNSIYGTAFSKLLSVVPKVGSGLGGALAKGETMLFNKIDKKNSKTLADLVYHFSDHKQEVRSVLIQSSIDVFFSFESQFMQLSCNGGPKRVMQKLAKDAADRVFNYFLDTEQKKDVTREEVSKGVLLGDSKRNRLGRREGKSVVKDEVKWKTCELYREAGLVFVDEEIFFKNKNSTTEKYGHRRPFSWEKIEEIKETWEQESGFEIPKYTLTSREDFSKLLRDYIMTKDPYEAAKLEREDYNKEALDDRQLKHDEVLGTFREQCEELLEELEKQYKVVVESHREHREAVAQISKTQEEDKVFHTEISTRLEEIRRDISETKVLIERREAVVTEAAGCVSVLTVEEVKEIAREEANKDVGEQVVEVIREKLRKNDPGPRIHREVNRTLRKLKLKW